MACCRSVGGSTDRASSRSARAHDGASPVILSVPGGLPLQQEYRMVGRIGQRGELFADKSSVFRPVLLHVGGDQRSPLGGRDLPGREAAFPPARSQLTLADRPEVSRPVRIAPRGDEVSLPLVLERQNRHRVATAGGATADGQGRGQHERGPPGVDHFVVEKPRFPVGGDITHPSILSADLRPNSVFDRKPVLYSRQNLGVKTYASEFVVDRKRGKGRMVGSVLRLLR